MMQNAICVVFGRIPMEDMFRFRVIQLHKSCIFFSVNFDYQILNMASRQRCDQVIYNIA